MPHAYTYAVSKDTGSIALQMTLYVIAMHVNVETGCTYAGIKTLMREARVKSDRTMRNYVAKLEAKGLIRRQRRHRKDGSRSTDNIELVGFRDWYLAHLRVADPAAKITGGGAARFTGGSGKQATAHYHYSNKKLIASGVRDTSIPVKQMIEDYEKKIASGVYHRE